MIILFLLFSAATMSAATLDESELVRKARAIIQDLKHDFSKRPVTLSHPIGIETCSDTLCAFQSKRPWSNAAHTIIDTIIHTLKDEGEFLPESQYIIAHLLYTTVPACVPANVHIYYTQLEPSPERRSRLRHILGQRDLANSEHIHSFNLDHYDSPNSIQASDTQMQKTKPITEALHLIYQRTTAPLKRKHVKRLQLRVATLTCLDLPTITPSTSLFQDESVVDTHRLESMNLSISYPLEQANAIKHNCEHLILT